jgi:RNA polymerase sigma factor (sigma-70 family)
MGIAINLYRNWVRHGVVSDRVRRRHRLDTPSAVEDDLAAVDDLIDLAQLQPSLKAALDKLSPLLREAVILRVGFDWSYTDIAARLGCSLDSARTRVARALGILTNELAPSHE